MRIAIAGEPTPVEELARALSAAGADVVRLERSTAAAQRGGPADLTVPLLDFESRLNSASDAPVDAVVLADSSDTALAAALVAAKIPLPLLVAMPSITAAERNPANTRLIATLADAAPGADASAILAAASERSGTGR